MRQLYELHKMIANSETDPRHLARILAACATSLGSLFSEAFGATAVCSSSVATLPIARPQHDQAQQTGVAVIRAAARAFASIMHGFDMLDVHSDDHRWRGAVIYQIARIFSGILDCLIRLATVDTETTDSVSPARGSKRSTSPARTANPSTKPILEALKQLLAAILTSLDPIRAAHNEIFEGVLFLLVERTSSLLYLYTFSRSRTKCIATDIARPAATDTDLRAASVSAPYLIDLLKLALRRAPKNLRPSPDRGVAAQTSATNVLGDAARVRLQRTLINCTFGSHGMPREALADCLAMPQPMDVPVARGGKTTAKGKKAQSSDGDWFTGELWALIGWEIMGQEGNLAEMMDGSPG